MSAALSLPVADPPGAGGAESGARLLGLVQRMMRTGMAMARCVNRIARQRLAGQDLSLLAPAGFDATFTNSLVVLAVAWTAALRERVLALRVRPGFAPGLPKPARGPRAGGATVDWPEAAAEAAADDRHDWRALAQPLRVGPSGVAVAARMIAGLSDRDVVTGICDKLRRAAAELGAEADVERIAALEAAARALCPEADAPEHEADVSGAAGGASGAAGGARGARAAGALSDPPGDGAEDDPPPVSDNDFSSG